MSLSLLIGAYIHPVYRLSEVIMYLKNGFNFLADSNISKSAPNSLKQIYRTCLITVCFVHNVPSFFAIIVLTLWYFGNGSGIVRGLFGIPSVRVFWRNDTYVFTLLWQNAAFKDILLSLQQQAIVIVKADFLADSNNNKSRFIPSSSVTPLSYGI